MSNRNRNDEFLRNLKSFSSDAADGTVKFFWIVFVFAVIAYALFS